jgi:tRNA A37 N6-isopentenylltransferase MiaA
MVIDCIQELHAKNITPIIEGGSGFYLRYLLTSSDCLYNEEIWNKVRN